MANNCHLQTYAISTVDCRNHPLFAWCCQHAQATANTVSILCFRLRQHNHRERSVLLLQPPHKSQLMFSINASMHSAPVFSGIRYSLSNFNLCMCAEQHTDMSDTPLLCVTKPGSTHSHTFLIKSYLIQLQVRSLLVTAARDKAPSNHCCS